jgi:hypothetical protein
MFFHVYNLNRTQPSVDVILVYYNLFIYDDLYLYYYLRRVNTIVKGENWKGDREGRLCFFS